MSTERSYRLRPMRGRVILRLELPDVIRKEGLVYLVDSSRQDCGPYVVKARVVEVHPEQIELGDWSHAPDIKKDDVVLVERKAAKRVVHQMLHNELASCWTNYVIAVIEPSLPKEVGPVQFDNPKDEVGNFEPWDGRKAP